MREKELRIALVCYGGVSLAVYMHGITKEIWRLAKASQAVHSSDAPTPAATASMPRCCATIAGEADIDLRVLVDILAGASAGGINAIFLGHAIATGQTLDPLTDLWLDSADVDSLLDPGGSAMSRVAKLAAVPVAWALSQRSGTIDKTVEPAHRAEIKAKLANFVRAPWFAPPFGGTALTNLILDAFDAMDEGPEGRAAAARLPAARPVRHRHRFPRLSREAPAQFAARGDRDRASAHPRLPGSGRRRRGGSPIPTELVFAARATTSFPGAFPPFRVGELDHCLETSAAAPGRAAPPSSPGRCRSRGALGEAEEAVLIDGSVLANAPVRPGHRGAREKAVAARGRPALRLYRPQARHEERPADGARRRPSRPASSPPSSAPLRHSARAADPRQSRGDRADVGADPAPAGGSSRRCAPRSRRRSSARSARASSSTAQRRRGSPPGAPRRTISPRARPAMPMPPTASSRSPRVVEEMVETIFRLGGGGDSARRTAVRGAIWRHVRAAGLVDADAVTARGRARRRDRLPGRLRPHLPHPPAALRRPPADRRWPSEMEAARERGRAGAPRSCTA